MLLRIHPETPSPRQVDRAVQILRDGGVIIYPTDSVYAMGCDMTCNKAVERVAQLKGIDPTKADFSLICHDFSHLSDFGKIENHVFKLMKKNLPGPFTFILPASSNVPKLFKHKKKTIGIRIPDNKILLEIVRELGNPLISTSIHDEDEIIEYITDPELIYEKYEQQVDLVIDGGFGNNEPSTVIDCTGDEIVILRHGIKEIEY